jgi:hypothetical protein
VLELSGDLEQRRLQAAGTQDHDLGAIRSHGAQLSGPGRRLGPHLGA